METFTIVPFVIFGATLIRKSERNQMNFMDRFSSNYLTYPHYRGALLIALCVLPCAGLIGSAFAVDPPPDGGYPNDVTAEGESALSDANPGADNTGIGFEALQIVTSAGIFNTAVGSGALRNTTSGSANLAVGYQASIGNTTGQFNTAVGYGALASNTTGT